MNAAFRVALVIFGHTSGADAMRVSERIKIVEDNDFEHPDEGTRHQWQRLQVLAQVVGMPKRSDALLSSILESQDLAQPIGSKSKYARIDSAKIAKEVTRQFNSSRDMSTHPIQNVTVNDSAGLSRQKDQERQSKLISFAPQAKSRSLIMLISFRDGGQLVARSCEKFRYGIGCFLRGLLVLVVIKCAVSFYYWVQQRCRADHLVMVREVRTLRTTIVKSLQTRKEGDWLGTLSSFIKLRSDKVNENHPGYGTIAEHFGESIIQSEIQKLLSQLSGGEELINKDAIQTMCSGFRIVITNLDSLGDPYRYKPQTPKEYQWFVDCIDYPLPCSDFATIFVLWLAYFMQLGIIIFRKDHATQAARGDSVDRWDVEYFVDVRERVAYHARLTTGRFDRLGNRVYASRDVDEVQIEHESS